MLTTRRRVRDAAQRLAHVDVADAAVLVDARSDVVDATGGELVRQVGVGQQLAPHRHEVGLAVGDHTIGLVGLEAPERDHRHRDASLGLGRVVAQRADDVRRVGIGRPGRVVGVRGDVHRVDAGGDRELDRLELFVPAFAVGLVRFERVDPDPHREVAADTLAHRADHFDEQPRPSFEAPAPAVVTRVAGREELVDQVSVPGVQLHAVEPGAHAPVGGFDVARDHPREVVFGRDAVLELRARPREGRHHPCALRGRDHAHQRVGRRGIGDVRHEHRASFGDVEQRDAPLVVQLRGDQRAVAVHSLRQGR